MIAVIRSGIVSNSNVSEEVTCQQNRVLEKYVVELIVLLHLGPMSNLESDMSLELPSLRLEGEQAIAGFEK